MIDQILEAYPDEEFLRADGFDDAIIGVSEDFNAKARLIYSVKKCIKILMEGDMFYEDAVEYFDFNVSGAYVGERTPVWCRDDY
jgi:hypothetical protein